MLKKILPIVLFLFGAGAGVGAGLFLRPPPEVVAEGEMAKEVKEDEVEEEEPGSEFVKMTNQFVVPIVEGGRIASLVVLGLSVEVPVGQKSDIYLKEPRLRNSFLQVMFDHANTGGFSGNFTDVTGLEVLREGLVSAAHRDYGENVLDVVIQEIARQDY